MEGLPVVAALCQHLKSLQGCMEHVHDDKGGDGRGLKCPGQSRLNFESQREALAGAV